MVSDKQKIIISQATGQLANKFNEFFHIVESPYTQWFNNIKNYILHKTNKHDQVFFVHSSSRVSDCNRSGQTTQVYTMVSFRACHMHANC